jgi:hypothetical protein
MQRKILGLITLVREFVRESSPLFLDMSGAQPDLTFSSQVVTRQSATHGADEIDTIMLETDHRGLNKFPDRNSNYHLLARELLKMLPQTRSVSASDFTCLDVDQGDADYPGRFLWYRKKVGSNGYPAGARVDPEYAARNIRPVGDTILTCRRTANAGWRREVTVRKTVSSTCQPLNSNMDGYSTTLLFHISSFSRALIISR